MSVLFGAYQFDGAPAPDLRRISSAWDGRLTESENMFRDRDVSVLYPSSRATNQSQSETLAHLTGSGAIITWDGRLDNRDQLRELLSSVNLSGQDDLSLVAAAYERWGTGCFAKLLGDWALAIAERKTRSVLLAKDFIGIRPLYYRIKKGNVVWSTVLDALVSFDGCRFDLEGEFIAGLLALFPATHLTPYAGIHSVPPACFVRVTQERQSTTRYWDFDPGKQVRYGSDGEYEEHFRAVFRESVRRRLRSDAPMVAELSGGIDSSAIVCVADDIIREGCAQAPRLDTISYFDDAEPDWDERPYFMQVEKRRGRTGLHINLALEEPSIETTGHGPRVLLSGVGGDEVTGGIPNPLPELADLILQARFVQFVRQLNAWAMNKRRPWVHLLRDVALAYLRFGCLDVPECLRPPLWIGSAFRTKYAYALRGYPKRMRLGGPLPSFQENMDTLEVLRRQLGCSSAAQQGNCERRYPFLDRDLLEFLFAIPREQVLRPGQRRSLMRRALTGVVPDEILHRRRKAFASRRPIVEVVQHSSSLQETVEPMLCVSLGIIDAPSFREEVSMAVNGRSRHTVTLVRVFDLEAWLKETMSGGYWSGSLGKRSESLPY